MSITFIVDSCGHVEKSSNIATYIIYDLKFRDKFQTQQELQKLLRLTSMKWDFHYSVVLFGLEQSLCLFDVSLSFSLEKVRSQFTFVHTQVF